MRMRVLFLLLLFLSFSIASVKTASSLSDKGAQVGNELTLAQKAMDDMASSGLSVTRYNDTLSLANQVYEAQIVLEKAGSKPDYSFVEGKLAELDGIKQNAFKAFDELKALELAINRTADINRTAVLEIYNQAMLEFESERYEEALKSVEKCYEKISEEEAIQTKLRAFYEAASRGIMAFLQEWWKELLATTATVLLVIVLTYNRIMRRLLERRIRDLEKRKEAVKGLIMQTQKDYFEGGNTGEETYHIRTKKYAELIRDINRQIPLLKEELAMRRKRKI